VLRRACLEITPLVIGGRKEGVSNILLRETQGHQNTCKGKSRQRRQAIDRFRKCRNKSEGTVDRKRREGCSALTGG
jgi:hypothetical protein